MVIRGNPEAYGAWRKRARTLHAEYMRLRWNRIRAYVVTAAVLFIGFSLTGVAALINQSASELIWPEVAGVGLMVTLLLFLVGATIGSHYQRNEQLAKDMCDAWSLHEPLMARDGQTDD